MAGLVSQAGWLPGICYFWIMDQICGSTREGMALFLEKNGYARDYSFRILTSFYRNRQYDISRVADIPKKLKELVISSYDTGLMKPLGKSVSSDQSIKYLFRSGRDLYFETVFIPDGKRNTVCVSTQSGCRMGCPFCLTGQHGFRGNLNAGEIVSQVLSISGSSPVSHVVFMGMGEPMDNLEEVIKACEIFTSGWGLSLNTGKVTVSTVGIIPAVKRYLSETRCSLTVSLFSPFAEERREVVPAERRHPVGEIIKLMRDAPEIRNRRFSVAYVMIKDLNDSDRHLQELKRIFNGSAIRVNILPYHSSGKDSYRSSDVERMMRFRHELVISGISASIRRSRGADISAACGLLAAGLSQIK